MIERVDDSAGDRPLSPSALVLADSGFTPPQPSPCKEEGAGLPPLQGGIEGGKSLTTQNLSEPASSLPAPQRRPLRVLLLGDREDVLETIKNLHQRGFAPAGEWSRAIACPTVDEVMHQVVLSLPAESVVSILTRYLNR